jgi:hypothetical protein
LLIQGLDDQNYTITQELHFYLNTHATSYFGLVGKGTVTVKDRSLWDLKAQEKEGNLVMRTWQLNRDSAEQLIRQVRTQPARGYIQSGRTPGFFGVPYLNCLTWCLEQLHTLEIPDIPPIKENIGLLGAFLDTLTNFVCAIPERYLPTEIVQAEEDNPGEIETMGIRCVMM